MKPIDKKEYIFISKQLGLKIDFSNDNWIKDFEEKLQTSKISKKSDLSFFNSFPISFDFIRKYKNILNLYILSQHIPFPEDILEECKDDVDWIYVSWKSHLSEEFIENNLDRLSIYWICHFQKMSEDFIRKHKDLLYWGVLCRRSDIKESFLIENENKIDWDSVCWHENLSDSFIRKYSDRISFSELCESQKLSEDLMIELSDLLDWDAISMNQKMSESFILKFQDKINFRLLKYNNYVNLSEKFKNSKEMKIHFDYEKKIEEFKKNPSRKTFEIISNIIKKKA